MSSYIDRNRKAGGLYISLHRDQTVQELEGICERIIRLEYVQQEEGKSYSSTKHFEYFVIDLGAVQSRKGFLVQW